MGQDLRLNNISSLIRQHYLIYFSKLVTKLQQIKLFQCIFHLGIVQLYDFLKVNIFYHIAVLQCKDQMFSSFLNVLMWLVFFDFVTDVHQTIFCTSINTICFRLDVFASTSQFFLISCKCLVSKLADNSSNTNGALPSSARDFK